MLAPIPIVTTQQKYKLMGLVISSKEINQIEDLKAHPHLYIGFYVELIFRGYYTYDITNLVKMKVNFQKLLSKH